MSESGDATGRDAGQDAGQEQDPDRKRLDGHEIEAELLEDWRVLFGVLHGRFETGDFATGVRLVDAIGEAAEEMNHHPDVDLTYPRVDVRLTSHDVGGVTRRDVALARTITDLAGRVGAKPKPEEVSVLELGLDTWDAAEIAPFWAALLDYEVPEGSGETPSEILDRAGDGPAIWFQSAERHDPPQQRWHLDLRVQPEVAETRIRRALEAGGTMVSDERAPTFWVLADAQGNRACITTWHGRAHA